MFGIRHPGMTQIVGALIAVLVAILVLVQAVIPTVANAVVEANIANPAAQAILGLFTLLLAVAGVMFILKWLF